MRGIAVTLLYTLKKNVPGSHGKFLKNFSVIMASLFLLYAILFHIIMYYESVMFPDQERDYSILTGFYWTLVVMSTQGFGDIVFYSDLGKLFTMIVNMTGILLMLVMLPFVVLEYIYNPLMKAQKEASTPRAMPETMKGHVIITHYDAIADALIARIRRHRRGIVGCLSPQ